jgi:exodeoxyribonuclease V beta subunit
VLDVNRRSTAALVAATNALLDGDGVTGLLDGAITYDTPVRASGAITADDAGRPPLTVFTISPGGADAVRTALSDAIGGELEALRAAAPGWRKGDTARPFALRDVLVLTRSNRESDDVAHDLRARGLPCALVERDRLFDTREADELAHVLAAIAAPRDRSARLRALRTRFFAVPWDALQDVVDAPDHHPLLARLFEWSSLALHRNYETLFRRLVEDSRLAERALLLGGGERVVTNTWHVLELLLEEVARSRGDLHELAALLRRWIDDELHRQDDLDVQRAETDGDAVRVMTVHKAKGLEAPYVFLYGMISTPPPNDVRTIHDHAGRVLLVGKQPDPLDQQSKREAQEENQRLMYVAVTRAQLRLYLPRYPEGVLKGDGPPYVPLQRCLVTITGERAAHLRHHLDLVAVAGDAAPPAAPPSLAGLALPPPPEVAPLPPLPTAQRGLVVVSYTRLAHDLAGAALPTNLAAVDPAEFDVDDSVGEVADDELPPGAAAGLMLHDVLERVDPAVAAATADPVAWAAAPAVAAILADAARARGISPRHLPHAARLCHATLTAPLVLDDGAPLPALAAPGTRLAREVEFAFPLPGRDPDAAARGLVRGFIDVLVGYDDALWVLDYKSDLLPGATAAELTAAARHRTDARYAIQARLYALAAARLAGPRPLAGLLYHYVRHGVVVAIRTDDATLTRWAAWLADLELAP